MMKAPQAMTKIELTMPEVEILKNACGHAIQLFLSEITQPATGVSMATDDPGEPAAPMPPKQRALEAAMVQMLRSVRILRDDITRAQCDQASNGCVKMTYIDSDDEMNDALALEFFSDGKAEPAMIWLAMMDASRHAGDTSAARLACRLMEA